jgi:putative hydrolase of HD superfamily
MLIVHDLGEIYCGDTIVYDKSNNDKLTETESANRLFSMLRPIRQAEFGKLIQEFEERKTDESKYANAIDRMEPILQNICTDGETWKKYRISYERTVEVNRSIVSEGSVELWNFLLSKIDQMRRNHLFEYPGGI